MVPHSDAPPSSALHIAPCTSCSVHGCVVDMTSWNQGEMPCVSLVSSWTPCHLFVILWVWVHYCELTFHPLADITPASLQNLNCPIGAIELDLAEVRENGKNVLSVFLLHRLQFITIFMFILWAHIVAIALCDNTQCPWHQLDNFVITAKNLQVIELRGCWTTGIMSRERGSMRMSMDGGGIRTSCEQRTMTRSNRGAAGRPWCLMRALTLSLWCVLHAQLSCSSFSWFWPPSWCYWVFSFPCRPLQSWFWHSWRPCFATFLDRGEVPKESDMTFSVGHRSHLNFQIWLDMRNGGLE